jgi:Family of unknown function (DUF5947)
MAQGPGTRDQGAGTGDRGVNPGKREPSSFAALRRFVRPRAPAERCDFCSAELPVEHDHLLDPASRGIFCACRECVVSVGSQEGDTLKRIPRRILSLPNFQMSDAVWDDLMIPVGIAFFFYNSAEGRMVAYYPGPAGATESLLSLEAWQEVLRANPVLAKMEPDVEALLVNRLKGTQDYYLVPVDRCYELVGMIRINWKGLSGGTEVWEEIRKFYDRLKERSTEAYVATPTPGRPEDA